MVIGFLIHGRLGDILRANIATKNAVEESRNELSELRDKVDSAGNGGNGSVTQANSSSTQNDESWTGRGKEPR